MSLSRALAKLTPQITYSFRAFPGQGQSLVVLVHQLQEVGNTILEVRDDHVLCQQFTEGSDSWGCMLCVQDGDVVLCDSEDELRAHLDLVHEGWQIDEEGIPVVVVD